MFAAKRAWPRIGPTIAVAALTVAATGAASGAEPAGSVAGRSAGAVGAQSDEYPRTAGEAMRYYESWVDDWMDGPAQYLPTKEEFETWNVLETTAEKAAFIEWFWVRRDDDPRVEGNPFKEQFYEAVATANVRFRDFPRGWKSDRGRVWCTLGRADSMTRRSWGSVYGSGSGPDFEVWTYYTLGKTRGFSTGIGEFLVFFLEERIGRFAIWDFGFRTTGIWDRNIRMAFELSNEFAIKDPTLEFAPGRSEAAYVRELTEGTLPIDIDLGDWGAAGAGGMVAVPLAIRLGDLLFQPEGDNFTATIETEIKLDPGTANESTARSSWQVVLQQEQLMAVGSGAVHAVVQIPADPGSHAVEVRVSHPLAASEALWQQEIEVTEEPAAGLAVGALLLSLDEADDSALAVVETVGRAFSAGDDVVIGAWVRGPGAALEAQSLTLVARSGVEYPVEAVASRWAGGDSGPLIIEVSLPELEAGMYSLRVDFGEGLDAATIDIEIEG